MTKFAFFNDKIVPIDMVRDGTLITSPITDNVLEGIRRRTMIRLARADLGIPVVERTIDRNELYVADEAFLCGTGVQMAAIASIDKRPLGAGAMGPVTQRLHTRYFDTVRGRCAEFAEWPTPVYHQGNNESSANQTAAAF